MTRQIAILGLLALLAFAPTAMAQEPTKEDNSTRPDDAAWVEDCPPDMMCAAGGGDSCDADACSHAPTRGPADGSCENCRGDEPVQYGPDGCIDCSGPVDDGGTCMDGADAGEACDDGVQYLDGGATPPPDAESHGNAPDELAGAAKSVPGFGALALIGAFVAVIALLHRK